MMYLHVETKKVPRLTEEEDEDGNKKVMMFDNSDGKGPQIVYEQHPHSEMPVLEDHLNATSLVSAWMHLEGLCHHGIRSSGDADGRAQAGAEEPIKEWGILKTICKQCWKNASKAQLDGLDQNVCKEYIAISREPGIKLWKGGTASAWIQESDEMQETHDRGWPFINNRSLVGNTRCRKRTSDRSSGPLSNGSYVTEGDLAWQHWDAFVLAPMYLVRPKNCLLYTSDAADE